MEVVQEHLKNAAKYYFEPATKFFHDNIGKPFS